MTTSVIHKYPLHVRHTDIPVGSGAKVLTVQLQYGTPCAWVAYPATGVKTGTLRITMVLTGQEFSAEDVGEYVSTVQTDDGFVLHFFVK